MSEVLQWIGVITVVAITMAATVALLRALLIAAFGLIVALRLVVGRSWPAFQFFRLWWFCSLNPAWAEVFLRESSAAVQPPSKTGERG